MLATENNSNNLNKLQPLRKTASDHFFVLDQLKLPHVFEEIRIDTLEDAFRVIKDMNVRGAPFIAVVATQAIQIELVKKQFATLEELKTFVENSVEYLRKSRPTAVNLQNDTERLLKVAQTTTSSEQNLTETLAVLHKLIDELNQQYVDACAQMAIHGANTIISDYETKHPERKSDKTKLNVLTICNTGKLATPGDGTALGIVRELHRRGRLERLYVAETRPYNQGARLTATEAVVDKIPATLITDSMAGFLMQKGNVDLVVVGADRVAKNGDTANKIGTYTFAVLAKHHGVKFYVALPSQTIDLSTQSGNDIHIEERPKHELTTINGVQIAPSGIDVWNPSFDVTPSTLITRIIHESGEFEFVKDSASSLAASRWRELNAQSLRELLVNTYKIFSVAERETLSISEVGDGNLNLVFIVSSDIKQVIVKQALPYVRCVGPSWPFPLSRADFEYQALQYEYSVAAEFIPKPLVFDSDLAMIIMEYLPPPFVILRKSLIQRIRHPRLADDVAKFTARTHFFSSGLHLSNAEYRERVALWSKNTEMCTLTEQVIFSDPYVDAQYNRWTTPQLDGIVKEFKTNDDDLIIAITELRHKFITAKEVLLHGDLHTGSIMATPEETRVIDPEFAFYGPVGFDTGALIANLFLSYFSMKQHSDESNAENTFAEWILASIEEFYSKYIEEFLRLWSDAKNTEKGGDFPNNLINKSEKVRNAVVTRYFQNIFQDTLGFAAAKMIRRIIGIAHVEDLESISDLDTRAKCESAALRFARNLIVNSAKFTSLAEVTQSAREYFKI